jgi:hypothetical protein
MVHTTVSHTLRKQFIYCCNRICIITTTPGKVLTTYSCIYGKQRMHITYSMHKGHCGSRTQFATPDVMLNVRCLSCKVYHICDSYHAKTVTTCYADVYSC